MSGFAELDPVIGKWVALLGSKLFTEWADAPARYFYTSGDPPFECFQISIDEPKMGRIKVWARAIDTNDDSEFQMDLSWDGHAAELDNMLATAVKTIDDWKARPRIKPDPPSPW